MHSPILHFSLWLMNLHFLLWLPFMPIPVFLISYKLVLIRCPVVPLSSEPPKDDCLSPRDTPISIHSIPLEAPLSMGIGKWGLGLAEVPGRNRHSESEYILWLRWFRTLESSQWAQCPTLDSPLSFPHTHQPYYTGRCTCLWSFMVANGTSFISPRLSSLGTEDIWAEFCSLLSTTYWIHYQGPSCLIALYLFLPL